VGLKAKAAIYVAPERRDIVYDSLPYPGIRKPGFRVEVHYPRERDAKDKPNLRQEMNASIECNNNIGTALPGKTV
jgi:hypothetical protein